MAAGLNYTGKQITEMRKRIAEMTGEVSERLAQVDGRPCLQEQRFDRMLVAVEKAIDDSVRRGELAEVKTRLEVLERKVDSAA